MGKEWEARGLESAGREGGGGATGSEAGRVLCWLGSVLDLISSELVAPVDGVFRFHAFRIHQMPQPITTGRIPQIR